MFTDKVKHTENITLINNDTIISDKQSIAKMFNSWHLRPSPKRLVYFFASIYYSTPVQVSSL